MGNMVSMVIMIMLTTLRLAQYIMAKANIPFNDLDST